MNLRHILPTNYVLFNGKKRRPLSHPIGPMSHSTCRLLGALVLWCRGFAPNFLEEALAEHSSGPAWLKIWIHRFESATYGIWNTCGICIGYVKDICGISMEYLWDMFGISVEYVCDMCGKSMGYLWNMYGNIFGICMGYLWNMYVICMWYVWKINGIPMICIGYVCDMCEKSMGYLWNMYGNISGISVGFLWNMCGIDIYIYMEKLWSTCEISMGYEWDFAHL